MKAVRRSASMLLPIVLLGLVAVPAQAQFRAALQGTVMDSTGASIPGVAVVVTSSETGARSETFTNETGFYRVSGLAPGLYTITVTLEGFRESTVENVRIGAEETRGLDVTLEPGGVEETVTVTSAPSTLSTENPEIGGTLGTVEVQSLPQVGRDPYELVRLTPGVFGLGMRSGEGNAVGFPNQTGPGGSNNSIFQTENQVSVSANGQRVEGNNFQLDGVTAMSQAWGGAAVVTPNQEAVKEIRVVSSPYSAEFGRNVGAQVQVVSQNGTNVFHGSALFKRNTPGLNSFQNDWVGPNGEAPQRVNRLLSQYGGSVGGPVLRDKLFFFFSYEGLRNRSTRRGTIWVETPELLSAIQAQRPNSLAAEFTSYPGTTPRIANVLQTRDIGSLTGAPGQLVMDPAGGGLDGIPDVQQVELEGFENVTSQQFNLRVDSPITQQDQLAFSTFFTPVDTDQNPPTNANSARPLGDFTSERRNMVGTALWTRVISPTMLNEARVNVTRWYFDEIASNPGMPWGIPRLNINQALPEVQTFTFGPGIGPGVFYQTTYNARNMLTKVLNAHALRFGGEVIVEQNNDKAPWAGRPTYTFNNFWSFANDAPSSQNAFFDPATGEFTELSAYARNRYYALFVQDDWKLRTNLTVNLGLRWEYFAPLRSKNDQISNLLLGPDGSLVDAQLRVGGDLHEPDRNNFAPQVGFAWTPTRFEQRLAVRGGFGVGYNRLPGSRVLESRFNPPFFAGFFLEGPQIVYAPAANLEGFTYPANPNATLTFDPATGLPLTGPAVSVNATSEELENPYVLRYSLDTEYDLGNGWVGGIGYQGSRGRNLARVLPYHRFVAPNPRLGNVNLLVTDAWSNYNALLLRASRRYERGFLVGAEYRWSKSLDTCSNDHDCRQTYPFDQETEYGPSDYDVPHSFKAYGTWDLPFFRDRNDLIETVAGGWQLSGIVTASSGFPWTPVFGGDLCAVVVAGGGVCPLRPVAFTGDPLDENGNDVFRQQFGQFPGGPLEYFTPPPAGAFELPPRPGVGRNSFRGPRFFSVDMSATKRFAFPPVAGLGNDAGIELRANAFNLFNNLNLRPFQFNADNTRIEHPNFGRALEALAGRVVEFQARFSF